MSQVSDLVQQGITALQSGDKRTAQHYLGQAAHLAPNNQTVLLWLADTLEGQERHDVLNRVITINPSSREGQIAARKLERMQGSVSIYPEEEPQQQLDIPNPVLMGVAAVAVVLFAVWFLVGGTSPSPGETANAIIADFQTAGLEAANARQMTPDDYGLAPVVCREGAQRFFIPSLGEGNGGRLLVCPNADDATSIADYYRTLNEASALVYSHVHQSGNIVVQANGELSDEQFQRYVATAMQHQRGGAVAVADPTNTTIPTVPPATAAPENTAIAIVPTTPPPPTQAPEPTAPPATDTPLPTATPEPTAEPTALPATDTPLPTSTSEPTATPEPTAEPTPQPKPTPEPEQAAPIQDSPPITLSGTGNTVTDPMAVPFLMSRVTYSQGTDGLIQAYAHQTTGEREQLIVNEIGSNTGAWLFESPADEYFFEVDADGDWTITIEPLGFLDQNTDTLSGNGAWVTDVYQTAHQGRVPYVVTYEGDSLAQIYLHCDNGTELVFNEIGTMTSETVLEFRGNFCLWQIVADEGDAWSISPR
jgi:outer membrane biosynthesis protein TonB